MRLTLAQKALEGNPDDGDGPHSKEQHRAAVVCERDEAKRRIAAGNKQVDAAVVDDTKHALGARGLNRVIERGGQVFEDDPDAIDNRRGHVGRASAAQGSEYDQEHQARDTQQAADTMGDGVHDLLTHRVVWNGRGLGSRLRTVARIGHAGYILQHKRVLNTISKRLGACEICTIRDPLFTHSLPVDASTVNVHNALALNVDVLTSYRKASYVSKRTFPSKA